MKKNVLEFRAGSAFTSVGFLVFNKARTIHVRAYTIHLYTTFGIEQLPIASSTLRFQPVNEATSALEKENWKSSNRVNRQVLFSEYGWV